MAKGVVAPAARDVAVQATPEQSDQELQVVRAFAHSGVNIPNELLPPGDYRVLPEGLAAGRGTTRGGHVPTGVYMGRE